MSLDAILQIILEHRHEEDAALIHKSHALLHTRYDRRDVLM